MARDEAKVGNIPTHAFSLMYRVYKYILPDVDQQLVSWRQVAEQIPDDELRKQAIDSMESKRFHCEGGAVYAVAQLTQRHILTPLIVAFQTISDYLDNLCDRSTSLDEADFRLLHQAMLDAIDPAATLQNYYALRDETEDGGYLHQLVRTCQSCILLLPSYSVVQPFIREFVSLYCDLQVYKHLHTDIREEKLLAWWEIHKADYPMLKWNEFAAATGSTLGVFMLFTAASDDALSEQEAVQIKEAYFPYISGLHILLDYLIDQEEDRLGGDLNFCFYYEDQEEMIQRIRQVLIEARKATKRMQASSFHRMIVEGLIALYLSDPKVKKQQDVQLASKQLMKNSPWTRLFFWINSVWIRKTM